MSQIHMLHRTGWLILLGFTLGVLYSKITSSCSPEDSQNSGDAPLTQEEDASSHADRIGDPGDAATTSLDDVASGPQALPSTSDGADDCETPKLRHFASPAVASGTSVLFAPYAEDTSDDGIINAVPSDAQHTFENALADITHPGAPNQAQDSRSGINSSAPLTVISNVAGLPGAPHRPFVNSSAPLTVISNVAGLPGAPHRPFVQLPRNPDFIDMNGASADYPINARPVDAPYPYQRGARPHTESSMCGIPAPRTLSLNDVDRTHPVNSSASPSSSALSALGTSRQNDGDIVEHVNSMIYPQGPSYSPPLLSGQSGNSSACSAHHAGSLNGLAKPEPEFTILAQDSNRLEIAISCKNPNYNLLDEIPQDLNLHHGGGWPPSLKLDMVLLDSPDKLRSGFAIMEQILIPAGPALHTLRINAPDIAGFPLHSQMIGNNITFSELRSFSWHGCFTRTFFSPVHSLPNLPFNQLDALEFTGCVLAVNDCINILHRCSSLSKFTLKGLGLVEAVLGTVAIYRRRELKNLMYLNLAASAPVNIQPLLRQVGFPNVKNVFLDFPPECELMVASQISAAIPQGTTFIKKSKTVDRRT